MAGRNEVREAKKSNSLHLSSSKTMSVENMQSLNAAYTTSPSHSNIFEKTRKSQTLGRISRYLNSELHKLSIMASAPNLSLASGDNDLPNSYTGQDAHNSVTASSHSNQFESSGSGMLYVSRDSSKRSSGGDLILQLQEENQALRSEIDLKESKLQSSMNSIKTFWSPELKKERTLRKEEGSKVIALREQLQVAQEESRHSQLTVHALHDELRAQKDLNQLYQDEYASTKKSDLDWFAGLNGDSRLLQDDNERLTRENELLQRTMEEMESRIEAQRQTLETRDESVRKLLEMLQCKSLSKSDESNIGASVELDALRIQLTEFENRLAQSDSLLRERTVELQKCKQELHNNSDLLEDSSKLKAMQSMIDVKDTKIASLERIIHELEDEMSVVRNDDERQEEIKQLEIYKNHSNLMKAKIDQLKSDLQKKETEMISLQTRLDTLNNQLSDSRQHIDVLKESVTAKEQRAAILQAEVDSLRSRMDEKQQILDQKQEHLSRLQEERSSSGSELSHLRDTLDVKDRKITVLHKKIESLAEVVREKDRQLEASSKQLSALRQDSSTSDSALTTMEEALTEKDNVIEDLRASQRRLEQKSHEEIEELRKAKRSMETRLETLQRDIDEKETRLSEVQEHASSLASSSVKKESRINQLEASLQQRVDELSLIESRLNKSTTENDDIQAQQADALKKVTEESEEKIENLEKMLEQKTEESSRSQRELDRLLEILKETENEKHTKDKTIATLEKQANDLKAQLKSLNTQMIEEMKKKGAAQDKDLAKLLRRVKSADDRVEELEEALRASVTITSEREMVLSKESETRHQLEKQLEELLAEFQQTKTKLDQTGAKLATCEASLHEKERFMQRMRAERKQQMKEVLEVKSQALLAAVSEKDANIALLEVARTRRKMNDNEINLLQRERDQLMKQLQANSVETAKLALEQSDDVPHQTNHATLSQAQQRSNGRAGKLPNSDEDDGDGIWA